MASNGYIDVGIEMPPLAAMNPFALSARLHREDGGVVVEYGVIVAVIALFLASSGTLLVQGAQDMFDRIGVELSSGLGEPAPGDPPPDAPAPGDPPPGGGGGGGKSGETPGHGKGSGGGKGHK